MVKCQIFKVKKQLFHSQQPNNIYCCLCRTTTQRNSPTNSFVNYTADSPLFNGSYDHRLHNTRHQASSILEKLPVEYLLTSNEPQRTNTVD